MRSLSHFQQCLYYTVLAFYGCKVALRTSSSVVLFAFRTTVGGFFFLLAPFLKCFGSSIILETMGVIHKNGASSALLCCYRPDKGIVACVLYRTEEKHRAPPLNNRDLISSCLLLLAGLGFDTIMIIYNKMLPAYEYI